jgi:hypothetical protein
METPRAGLGRDLTHALRTGPFSAALHLAIEDRGLRLEEIQERLAAAGVKISLSMLSYWRRGRSQPERPESIKAVHLLEEILALPTGSLIAQLGPRRPRGRWPDQQPPGKLTVDRLFDEGVSVLKMVGELDRWLYHELTRVLLQDVYLVGAHGQETSLICRQVLRANVDRVQRTVGIFGSDDRGSKLSIVAVRNCRIGRTRMEKKTGVIAAEIVFDRILDKGDTVAIEYEFKIESTVPTGRYYRGFSVPGSDFVLQVQFDPASVPARCYRFERRNAGAPDQGVKEVWIGSMQGAHLLATDVPPGVVGLRWDWD